MNIDKLNTSSIETFLHSILYKKVSDNVFIGRLPSTIQSSWVNMVVVDCGNNINDRDAYGFGVVSIILYAKNKGDGTKNVAALSAMHKSLNSVLSTYKSDNYSIQRAAGYSDYDTASKLHFDVVLLNLMAI